MYIDLFLACSKELLRRVIKIHHIWLCSCKLSNICDTL